MEPVLGGMDTHKLVADLGGVDHLSQRLRDLGVTSYSPAAVAKWRQRGLPNTYSLRLALAQVVETAGLDVASREAAMATVRAP